MSDKQGIILCSLAVVATLAWALLLGFFRMLHKSLYVENVHAQWCLFVFCVVSITIIIVYYIKYRVMGQKVTTKYKTGDIIDVICPKCGGEVDGVVNLENKPPDVVSIGYHYLDFKSEIKVKCEGTGETVRLPG